jgi:hypothetical protein
MNKTFFGDFDKFLEKLRNKEPFALSRNNDGEMIILNNEFIDLTAKCNGEFIYDPSNEAHAIFREDLLDSARLKSDNYYVGIACRCCVGDQKHEQLKQMTGQSDEMLTWGNIFVNGNYNRFESQMIPEFKNYDVTMIINNNATPMFLSFSQKIRKIFRVGTNAWMSNYAMIEELKAYIKENDLKNHLFLVAAGPFSNILIMEGYKTSSQNTYLDIGSTLDSKMGLGATRGYLNGADTLSKVCVW